MAQRVHAIGLICALTLSACGGDGKDRPPAAFGALQGAWFGCPSMAGLYTRHGKPWSGVRPVVVHWERAQFWIRQDGNRMRINARQLHAQPVLQPESVRDWSWSEYHRAEYVCRASMLEVQLEDPQGKQYPDRKLPRAFRLARLADGGLAVGIKTIIPPGKESLYSYDSAQVGTYTTAPRVVWTWSRLEPVAGS